jgi:signal transduction histidine kinase/ActR/RegA family two-component response regulator
MGMDPGHEAGADRAEFEERIRALYRQSGRAGWASVVVALCLVAVMWRFVPSRLLLAWLALTLAVVAIRIPLLRAHAGDPRRGERARTWARRYTWMVLAHGCCWGLASILFLDAASPFGVASFLVVAALVPTANVATQSNHLPAVYAILASTLVPAVVRLAFLGGGQYLALAVTLSLYLTFLVGFARLQSRTIGSGLRLRLENLALIEALKVEKEQAEAQRERAEQASLAKSRFLAAASHDLRQPLHALGLFSASLRDMTSEPQTRAHVDRILTSVDALESLLNELLDLSRLDAGQVSVHRQAVRVRPLFERLRAAYTPLAQSKGLALVIEDTGTVVHTDPALMERVLGNLLSNAIRYTDQGSVVLRATPQADHVRVEIRDTGVGISQEHRERIFEEFFQVGNPERDRSKGLGLGLAIVRRIVNVLGHSLELESATGHGSCFALRVPPGNPAEISTTEEPPRVMGDLLRGRTILVIEDEAMVREGTASVLAAWGSSPRLAADADEAVREARHRTPDLIVADLRLRDGASGLEAIADVRHACGRNIPALVVTGDIQVDVLREAKDRGNVVLHKPVTPAKLRATLSQLLASTRADEEAVRPE